MADAVRATGVPVVKGGPHVTAVPGEALGREGEPRQADAVALGEADRIWPEIVPDGGRESGQWHQVSCEWPRVDESLRESACGLWPLGSNSVPIQLAMRVGTVQIPRPCGKLGLDCNPYFAQTVEVSSLHSKGLKRDLDGLSAACGPFSDERSG